MKMEKTTVKNSKQALDIKKNEASKDNGAFRYASNTPSVELAKPLQFKYALLLNTEVEEVKNLKIYEYVDDWYGTRYCMGGTTKSCIDCSAFVQAFFAAIYSVAVPRTAREQYKASRKISQTEIKEGDLLFFNTRGGISHVGIYLQNNKFVHASTSGGVMISDMFESYWVKKLVGVGRINTNAVAVSH
ncbi:MAG: hypothetical protein GC171_14860 [Terrimonas sp.]|nr:hypothetical protein [Terrimonas sp.]